MSMGWGLGLGELRIALLQPWHLSWELKEHRRQAAQSRGTAFKVKDTVRGLSPQRVWPAPRRVTGSKRWVFGSSPACYLKYISKHWPWWLAYTYGYKILWIKMLTVRLEWGPPTSFGYTLLRNKTFKKESACSLLFFFFYYLHFPKVGGENLLELLSMYLYTYRCTLKDLCICFWFETGFHCLALAIPELAL